MHAKKIGRLAGLSFILANAVIANAHPVAPAVYAEADERANLASAYAAASGTLDRFLSHVIDGTGHALPEIGLKVEFPNTDGTTRMAWISPFTITETGFRGRPQDAPESQLDFDRSAVRDWYVIGDDGLMYGAYTTRSLLTEDATTAALQLRKILSPVPLPATW